MITDPEATNTGISVSSKMAARPMATVGEYRQVMVERLFSAMLSARLDEIARAPNAPFLLARTGRGLLVRAEEVTNLDALVAKGGVERGLAAGNGEGNRHSGPVLGRPLASGFGARTAGCGGDGPQPTRSGARAQCGPAA